MRGDVRIIGVGSPHGDDRAGWAALAALAGRALPSGVQLRTCVTPATDLLPALRGARRAVFVDAVAGAAPGRIVRGDRSALAARRAGPSSHGVDLCAMLELAEALGALPAELAWVGVTIDPRNASGDGLSPRVAAALPALGRAALEEATR